MMTFAEELRHVISVEPVLDAPDPPLPDAPEADWQAWQASRIPKVRDPGPVRVLDVEAGFDELLAMCRTKAVFARPMWAEMHPPEGDDEAQLRWYLDRKCPDPAQAALWCPGPYFRLFYRTYPAQVWSQFLVGSSMTLESRRENYRALWDVGIREIHYQVWPENPHAKKVSDQLAAMLGDLEVIQEEKYVHYILHLKERP